MQFLVEGTNSTSVSANDDPISNVVRISGNFGIFLHYLSAFPVAYYLAPALTLLAKAEAKVQQISPFSDKTSKTKIILLKWGYTLAISIGYSLSLGSLLTVLSSYDRIICALMLGFKIYSSVLAIQTFDTVYRSVSIHFIVMVNQFRTIKDPQNKFRYATCIKEQVDLIQKGFGCYFLSQYAFLTVTFVLYSYDVLLKFMIAVDKTFLYINITGTVLVIMARLAKIVMIAYSVEWMKEAVDGVRSQLMEQRELCTAESDVKVKLNSLRSTSNNCYPVNSRDGDPIGTPAKNKLDIINHLTALLEVKSKPNILIGHVFINLLS